jgi:hypothetical protein
MNSMKIKKKKAGISLEVLPKSELLVMFHEQPD